MAINLASFASKAILDAIEAAKVTKTSVRFEAGTYKVKCLNASTWTSRKQEDFIGFDFEVLESSSSGIDLQGKPIAAAPVKSVRSFSSKLSSDPEHPGVSNLIVFLQAAQAWDLQETKQNLGLINGAHVVRRELAKYTPADIERIKKADSTKGTAAEKMAVLREQELIEAKPASDEFLAGLNDALAGVEFNVVGFTKPLKRNPADSTVILRWSRLTPFA